MISQFAGVAITTSVRESSVLAPPDITISPLHTSEFQLTVFKSVDSSLSVLRLEKFVSITDFDAFIAEGSVFMADIVYS